MIYFYRHQKYRKRMKTMNYTQTYEKPLSGKLISTVIRTQNYSFTRGLLSTVEIDLDRRLCFFSERGYISIV